MIPIVVAPLAHTGGPEPAGPLYTHWILDPVVALGVIAITALYLAWVGPLNRRRPGVDQRPVRSGQVRWFIFGSILLLIALGPPIDDWSHYFFVSAHMTQHLVIMFAVVPCWLKGIPAWVYQPIVRHPRLAWLLTWVPRAVPSFVIVTMIMALWHVPTFYDATLSSEPLHALQHAFFLLAGFLFYWPLMSPVPESPQLSPPAKCLYLFVQTLPAGIIGALITYAAPGLYPHYEEASVRPWGISLQNDQELAGLIMWVGMNAIFLTMITVIFLGWANREERADFEALREEGRARRQHERATLPDSSVPTS